MFLKIIGKVPPKLSICLSVQFILNEINNAYFIPRSEDGDVRADEAEEVRSGDEEAVEPEEEPEGINYKFSTFSCNLI